MRFTSNTNRACVNADVDDESTSHIDRYCVLTHQVPSIGILIDAVGVIPCGACWQVVRIMFR